MLLVALLDVADGYLLTLALNLGFQSSFVRAGNSLNKKCLRGEEGSIEDSHIFNFLRKKIEIDSIRKITN